MYNIFFQQIKSLIPIKDTAEKALKRLGIYSARDLLFYAPYSYTISNVSSDISSFRHGDLVRAEVIIREIQPSSSRKSPLKIYTENNTGSLILVFFNKIPSFIYNKLKIGTKIYVAGKLQYFDGIFQLTHPDFIFNKALSAPVEPVYHLTYGISNKQLYNYIISAINSAQLSAAAQKMLSPPAPEMQSYMEKLLLHLKQLHLIGAKSNKLQIEQDLEQARKLLAAKELLADQIALSRLKKQEVQNKGQAFRVEKAAKDKILNNLDFALTNAQEQVIKEIEHDQASQVQMVRLLQGDVGCGKTVIALLTMINVVESGGQVAFMVPTDLLSVQHYVFFKKILSNTEYRVELLTGKTTSKQKQEIYARLKLGEIDILIGTHALFQENVEFKNLGYVVIDEQHRFGVRQRMELINKASHPDVLVMTATPIPRSLTLTMFGDMSISVVKEKPKNRLPVFTTTISGNKRLQVIDSLRKKIESGEKIYWVCPLIDQSNKEPASDYTYTDVISCYQEISAIYKDKVGIIHGKMKQIDKDSVMSKFKEGEIYILVATTVIEVGIDVPDAGLIVIENAERFGLAQLHQLRGRVGRSDVQSHCVLIYNSEKLSDISKQRLAIMKQSNDGFYIAEQDLVLRGSGEILGTKQSGEPELFFADLTRDVNLLLQANKLAKKVEYNAFTEFQIKLFAKQEKLLTKSG